MDKIVNTLLLFTFITCFTTCISNRPITEPAPQSSSRSAEAGTLGTTNFCELIKSPDYYDGKILRTEAIIVSGHENQFIYDPTCYDRKVPVTFDAADLEVFKTIDGLLERTERRGPFSRLKVTITARFQVDKEHGFGHLGSIKYRLLIIEVERSEAVPGDIPWPE